MASKAADKHRPGVAESDLPDFLDKICKQHSVSFAAVDNIRRNDVARVPGIDEQPDPHSPWVNFWWSHVGWLFYQNRDLNNWGTFAPALPRFSPLP